MPDVRQLTDLQLAIMRVLWERGEATAADVHEALRRARGLAPTTVATVLSRLEKKGVITHRAEGRQYFYRPAVSERDVRRSMVAGLTELLFEGDPAALVSHLITSRDVAPRDLQRVKELIREKEREGGGKGRQGGRRDR